ncbi:hypothetical protein [Streptomyces sp. NPDC088794]|uniref:hypothetical protein n=1 Tax=Streptomyces sp. NPDC088794 TaxID=3365902 RepID=UPI00380BB814
MDTVDAFVVGFTGTARHPRALAVRLPNGRVALSQRLTTALAAAAMSAPAHAGNGNDSAFGNAINAANNWNFTAAAVCLQEVAVVPVLGDWVGARTNNCTNGNAINHQ